MSCFFVFFLKRIGIKIGSHEYEKNENTQEKFNVNVI